MMFHTLIALMAIYVALTIVALILGARIIGRMSGSELGEEFKSNNPMIVFWTVKYADKFGKFLDDNETNVYLDHKIISYMRAIKIVKTALFIVFVLMIVVFLLWLER